jgi:hypothetical protein
MIWPLLSRLCAIDWIAQAIITRAMRTPYQHIYSKDGRVLYMGRWWLFNRYADDKPPRWSWLPSIRVHHIKVHDQDRHMHSHPWRARTIILRGWYVEQRPDADHEIQRMPGKTAEIKYNEFHRICRVAPGGCWTLFFTWRKQGTWFFDVDGKLVPWREYLDGGD